MPDWKTPLFEFLSIPSISTLPQHKPDIRRVLDWLTDYLVGSGFATENIQELYADGLSFDTNNPVLYAERIDDPSNPTILIYGHYDVQPADPIDHWKSEPFSPEIRDGNIYARGATDDKGQLFTHLFAINQLSKEWGEQWPVNFRLLIEGEEEIGGGNIDELLREQRILTKLQTPSSVLCLISDTGFIAPGRPTIEYGLRGLAYMQIDVKLADADLHSGLYGGGVLNPANALTQILAQLQDPKTGKVLIPGFYDQVVEVDDQERENLAAIPFDEQNFLKEAAGSKATFGEEGYSAIERTAARPTLDINGMWSGYQGAGAKTIIPATAHAKISMRTVADQDPDQIAELFTDFVKQIAPSEVDVEVQTISTGQGVLIDVNSDYMKLAADILEQEFGAPVTYSRSGGSIPVVALLQKEVGISDVIMMGYGLPDDNLHSPNEKLGVEQFEKGVECNKKMYLGVGFQTTDDRPQTTDKAKDKRQRTKD